MTVLRSRNGAVLFELEATEGVDPTPAATDAILVENPRISFDSGNVETNELTGSLDSRAPIVGGLKASVTMDLYVKGSGTAGQAPDFGDLFKVCGWEEVLTATAVPTGPQLLAAGSATTATLGSAASATLQAYRGMPLYLYRDSTSTPDLAFVTDYTTGKVATLTGTFTPALGVSIEYQVPKNVLYKPTSDASLIKTATIWMYMDGVLYKFLGMRGTFTLAMQAGQPGKFSFTFTGIFSGKSDAAVPSVSANLDTTRPPIWRNPNGLTHRHGEFSIDRGRYPVRQLSFDNGTPPTYVDNPNATEGFDPSVIVRRQMAGSIDPLATLVATRDMLTTFRAGTSHILHARLGDTAGNRFGIVMPTIQQVEHTPGDRDGLMTEEIRFRAVGEDSGSFLAFF